MNEAELMPASSPAVKSAGSMAQPFRSQYRVYIRYTTAAQPSAPTPPAPLFTSTPAPARSWRTKSIFWNSRAPRSRPTASACAAASVRVDSSPASSARSESACASSRARRTLSYAPATCSSCAFSFRSAWAFALSVQKDGASDIRVISSTRPRLRSTSKRPPERLEAARQLGEAFLRRSGHRSGLPVLRRAAAARAQRRAERGDGRGGARPREEVAESSVERGPSQARHRCEEEPRRLVGIGCAVGVDGADLERPRRHLARREDDRGDARVGGAHDRLPRLDRAHPDDGEELVRPGGVTVPGVVCRVHEVVRLLLRLREGDVDLGEDLVV